MQHTLRGIFAGVIGLTFLTLAQPTQAINNKTIYGALYPVANLAAEQGKNTESVVGFVDDGYFAYTTNDQGLELWTSSDNLALTWVKSDTNPLNGCTQVGRHTRIEYKGETYLAANCDDEARIYQQTGVETVELKYTRNAGGGNSQPGQPVMANYYPTAAVIGTEDNEKLAMFYNGGVTLYDGTTFTDHTDLTDQPSGVPLESSTIDNEGNIYLAFTSGEVMKFDGVKYTRIGEEFLEGGKEPTKGGSNLPAVAVFNNHVYVGNQDMENGASLFTYDLLAEDAEWEEVVQLPAEDIIVNKMALSAKFGKDREYLTFFTSNGDVGTRVLAVDKDNDIIQLIDSGLGGGSDEQEVVSTVARTVKDGNKNKEVILFATQNQTNETSIYVLHTGENLAITPKNNLVVSRPDDKQPAELASLRGVLAKTKKAQTAKGESFKLNVSKKQVNAGDKVILYVNGKAVDTKVAKKNRPVTLSYKKSAQLAEGDTFRVSVGRQPVYGSKDDRQVSSNIVKGSAMKVTVKK